jgi:trans-aconitate 2-methyltransferase
MVVKANGYGPIKILDGDIIEETLAPVGKTIRSSEMPRWDPETYLRFADERSRPFAELVRRIEATAPKRVVDLGCGPGQLTASLADRWPGACVLGIDSSGDMINAARRLSSEQVSFQLAGIETWRPAEPVDVLLSNAALQWIPDHRSLLPDLVSSVTEDGWVAFQVPGNFAEPSHTLLRTLAQDPRYADAARSMRYPAACDAATYLADLTTLGCRVDAWETTYLHVLPGEDAVFTWISGTGARPVLQALDDDLRDRFVAEYKQALRAAYPRKPFGTVLPFRRVFVVAQRQP